MSNKLRAFNREVTIIVIDDDDVDFTAIERAVKKLKILNPVRRACDGVDGLALIREEFDLGHATIVLLDLNMPKMNGLELLDVLRSDQELKNTMVFVLTTSGAEEDISAAYSKSVAGYIVKRDVEAGFKSIIAILRNY